MLKLLLIFTIIPLLELWLLIEIGKIWGATLTVLLVAATGFLGVWLLKLQGVFIMYRIQEEIAYGQVPGDSMLDGLFLLMGGALLLTPGILTDLVGFSFLIPLTRQLIKKIAAKFIQRSINRGNIYIGRW